MTKIHTRLSVGPDHRISGVAPFEVPAGEHRATIILSRRKRRRSEFRIDELPSHDLRPWPERLGLGREDIYDEAGR